jgi:hypothetical protein
VVDKLSSVSVTGLRVQPVVMPFGDPESWTLVGRDSAVIEPVEGFLSHLHAVERSPNTVKAYAHDLRDWFEFLGQRGAVWSRVRLEDVGRFVAWLRLPASARVGNVAVLPGRRERVLGGGGEPEAVGDLGVLLVPSTPRRGSGGPSDNLAAAHGAWWVVATVVGAPGVWART